MNKDYKNLLEIEVHTQQELDEIPLDYKGRICIKNTIETIIVRNRYHYRVEAWGNSSVEARGNSSVVARGNSSVVAWGNSSVVAWGNSSVVAWGNSSVEARGNSSVVARGNSSVEARGNSSVVARGNSSVVAWENSSVVAWGNSSVVAWENSSVVAWENSSVVAWGNSSVEAWENSSVEVTGNVQVVDRLYKGKIAISGNARIVSMPKNIEDFMNFYNIKHTKTKGLFFKAVHKKNDEYVSDYNQNFKYEVGKIIKEECDSNVKEECSKGIHISSLQFALDFGCCWNDLAILECETKINDIVLPEDSDGKVRTSRIKVIREVPLSECGVYGKIIEKRLKR